MKFLRRFSVFVIALVLINSNDSIGQGGVNLYRLSTTTGTYTPITGGAVLGTGSTVDNNNYNSLPIGFTFLYNGTPYTTFSANANGFIAMGNSISSSTTALSSGSTHNVMAALNFNIQGNAGGELRYETIGTAPNRILVVQWSDFASNTFSSTGLGDIFNFQIRLEETTNNVKFAYGAFSKNATTRNAQVGLRGSVITDFRNISVVSGTSTWSTPVEGTTNTATAALMPSLLPSSGLTLNVDYPHAADVEVVGIESPAAGCGDPNDVATVRIKNVGSQNISNIPVTIQISNPNISLSGTLTRTIIPGATDTVKIGSWNTLPGGSFSITATANHPSDPNAINNSKTTGFTLIGTPSNPSVTPNTRCGVGSVALSATPAGPNDDLTWYPSSTSNTFLGTGASFNTPNIASTTTYYVQASRGVASSVQTIFSGGNSQAGAMVDVLPNSTVNIDSFAVNSASVGSRTIQVYYKLGTHVGFESTPSAWTLLGQATVNATATNSPTNVPIGGLKLIGGQTYGLYVQVTSGSLSYTNGGPIIYSNADITITTGVGKGLNFGANFVYRQWNGRIYYSNLCTSARIPVVATVNPKPAGSGLTMGTPFQGQFRAGTLAQNDIAISADVLKYDLTTPNGFNNTAYGTAWNITYTVATLNGTPVNSSAISIVNPSASGSGSIQITPYNGIIDSTLKITTVISNMNTNCDTTIVRWLYVAPVPDAHFTVNTICDGDEAVFTNTSTLVRGFAKYAWDFGDGSTSGARNPRHTYAIAGTYNVKLIVSSDLGYKDSITIPVVVNEIVNASFNAIHACGANPVTFTNNSTGPAGSTYEWDFGDNTNSTATNPSHVYNVFGIYDVKLTATTSGGCKSNVVKQVFQFADPVATFTSVAGCRDELVKFTNNSSISSNVQLGYRWTFGDGTGSESINPDHLYQNPGTYNVSLITTSIFGCDDTVSQQITVIATPRAAFTANNVCKGSSSDFLNATTIAPGNTFTSSWDFNDGNTSNSLSPSHTFGSTGTYAVKLTVSNGVCSDELVKTVEVFEKPIAGFNAFNVCLGNNTNFVNTSNIASGGVNYNWNFGDGNTSTSTNTSNKYSTAGQKTVWLKVSSDAGCVDSISKIVEVFPTPNSSFNVTHVEKRTYNFSTTATGTYSWTFGDASKSSTQNPSYTYFFDGQFKVCLTVTSAQGCESSTCQQVISNTTGISSTLEDEHSINIYPNPSTGIFTVKSTLQSFSASVYDIYGKLVKEIPASSVIDGETKIDLSGSSSGVYLVKINDGGNTAVMRITVK